MDLIKKLEDLKKAFERLNESLIETEKNKNNPYYSIFRDSAIQRFEFTIEIFWKTIKEFLKVHEGINCSSPKNCIREFFANGYITESETIELLELIDYRNLTSHTYHEELAEKIYNILFTFTPLIEKTINIIQELYD